MSNFNKNFLPLWFAAGVAFLMLFASETKALNYDTVISEDEYCMASADIKNIMQTHH